MSKLTQVACGMARIQTREWLDLKLHSTGYRQECWEVRCSAPQEPGIRAPGPRRSVFPEERACIWSPLLLFVVILMRFPSPLASPPTFLHTGLLCGKVELALDLEAGAWILVLVQPSWFSPAPGKSFNLSEVWFPHLKTRGLSR